MCYIRITPYLEYYVNFAAEKLNQIAIKVKKYY